MLTGEGGKMINFYVIHLFVVFFVNRTHFVDSSLHGCQKGFEVYSSLCYVIVGHPGIPMRTQRLFNV